MHTNKRENIVVATSALFTAVALMHFLRIVANVDLSIGGTSIAMWPSYLAVLVTGALAILNCQTLGKISKAAWLKYFTALFIIDALIGFYSWVSNLSYWGFSHAGFGWWTVFDLVVIIFLFASLKKASKK